MLFVCEGVNCETGFFVKSFELSQLFFEFVKFPG